MNEKSIKFRDAADQLLHGSWEWTCTSHVEELKDEQRKYTILYDIARSLRKLTSQMAAQSKANEQVAKMAREVMKRFKEIDDHKRETE